MSDRVVAVCPVVNGRGYTQAMVESLPPDLDLLIIDNGSTDDTRDYLDRVAHTRGRIAILTQPTNLGVPKSWNLGIWTAFEMGATFAFVVNFDIVCAPDTLARLLLWSRRGMDLPSVYAATRLDGPRVERWTMPGDFCAFLLSQAVVERVGWFDETLTPGYMEDLDFEMRVRACRLYQGSCHDAVVLHTRPSRAIYEGGVVMGDAFRKNGFYFRTKWGMTHEEARTLLARSARPMKREET